ncbi:MAG: winged helix-turn-helix transcriptional regulator [bacterium]|nr:winged helix-turn-helix transcriptional regulator [bacterium]
MEEMSQAGGVATQRDLAKRLNFSLGLVNSFIRRIVRKGYFKVATIPGGRLRYLLTPNGIMEKSRLTMEYLNYSMSYYRRVRASLRQLANDFQNKQVKCVYLLGTGELAELFLLSMQEAEIEILGVFSLDGAGSRFFGYPVRPLSALSEKKDCFICLMELDDIEKYLDVLDGLNINRERVVVGPGL